MLVPASRASGAFGASDHRLVVLTEGATPTRHLGLRPFGPELDPAGLFTAHGSLHQCAFSTTANAFSSPSHPPTPNSGSLKNGDRPRPYSATPLTVTGKKWRLIGPA
jgi:hypothetical protein